MIYTMIYGGLGNQMFQYAIAKNISISNNVDFKLDLSKMDDGYIRNFSLEKFKIVGEIASIEELKNYNKNKYVNYFFKILSKNNIYNGYKFFEKNEFVFDNNFLDIKKGYLEGYWQSFKYFENIREILLKEFTLKDDMNKQNIHILKKILLKNSISLHIRRGDYINSPKNKKIYDVVGLNYYQDAIKLINTRVENPYYFIFSDDLNWASENLNFGDNNMIFVDINGSANPENDLVLMSNCKHNIIANSTFSWWGAWLNQNPNKIVVSPNKWMSNINILDDLYPNSWLRL